MSEVGPRDKSLDDRDNTADGVMGTRQSTPFWGNNYVRLQTIKDHWAPLACFSCFIGVGSEAWSADAFVKRS